MKLDYIIVGFGLAGLSFAEQLEANGKRFIVFEDASQLSSRVAGGLFNPVILKRFTMAWQGSQQLEYAVPFYQRLEEKLKNSFVEELPVLRRFNSIEEQNSWFEAVDHPRLKTFLSSEILDNDNPALEVPFKYGQVMGTGRIAIKKMLSAYMLYLKNKQSLVEKSFDHTKLNITSSHLSYEGIEARHIVFAEGYGMHKNPFFNQLPLPGNKGEYLIIRAPDLKLNTAVKSSFFLLPLGDDTYKVGATYNNTDKSPETTSASREKLELSLKKILKVPYAIIDQVAGIRPSTKDRKPLVGTHPKHKNVHILNGFGSRGIMIGPTVSKKLYDTIETNTKLDFEIDIQRFFND